jgi:predicted regulator of Ras-like GTPase activity (Roadblock/LC7/MglB family)
MAPDDLTWILRRLVEDVPGTNSAVLLSVDGITKYHHGLNQAQADTLGALASGMMSLAQQVGTNFGRGEADGVRQVAIELDETILFVTSASLGSVLAVTAGREVNARALSYEMTMLCKQVPAFLATPSRGQRPVTGNGTVSA